MSGELSGAPAYASKSGLRTVRAAVRFAAVGGILWVSGCGDPDRAPPVAPAAFERISSRTLEPASDSSPWVTEVTAVFEHRSELLVVEHSSPHLRVYVEPGAFRSVGGRTGEGPGELGVPWRAAIRGDTLFVVSAGRISMLDLDGLEEIERVPVPSGLISLHPGCDGHRAYALVLESRAGTRHMPQSIRVTPSRKWEPGSFDGLQPAQFNPVGLNLIALQRADTLIFLDPWRRGVVRTTCEGSELSFQPVEKLQDGVPVVRGAALGEEGVVVLVRERGVEEELTRAFVVDQAGSVSTRLIQGDVRLHPAPDGSAWLVDNRMMPVLHRVEVADLIRVLSR